MIPDSLWGQSGSQTLDPSDWARIRQRVAAAAGHRCEICDAGGVQAAERWQYDDDRLVQVLVGVTALCQDCHSATTPGRAGWLAATDSRYVDLPERVRQRLAAVNEWSLEVTDAYIEWSFRVHALRCEYTWTSDWSYFARAYGVGDGVLPSERVCTKCYLAQPARTLDARGVCEECA